MLPALEKLADAQGGVFTRRQAIVAGYTRRQVDALLRSEWTVVARGVYAAADVLADRRAGPGGEYVLECAARRLRSAKDSVVSHESAALLHTIPLLDRLTGPVRLTVPPPRAATRGQVVGRYVAALPAAHRCDVQGVPVTTPARTVVDLARTLAPDAALVSVDAALRMGLDRGELVKVLAACRRWPGAEQAQELVVIATRWSESPLESLAMLWFRRQGLPLPEQQLTVRTQEGRWLARVDFVWPDRRTVCEVDGKGKYLELLDGATPADIARRGRAHWDEKVREDALRDAGLEVVRGYWRDREDDGAALADRLRRAFGRGAAAAMPGTYRISDERSHARTGALAT